VLTLVGDVDEVVTAAVLEKHAFEPSALMLQCRGAAQYVAPVPQQSAAVGIHIYPQGLLPAVHCVPELEGTSHI
jgi:hypothetical protein